MSPVQADGSDRFTHWIGVQRIITERIAAEQALRITTQRLNMAKEASGLGFWTKDTALNESFRDERWYTMLGYAPNNFPAHPDEWLKLVHPDDFAFVSVSESAAATCLDKPLEKISHAPP